MNELNDVVKEINQMNDYLNDVYQDIESSIYLGQDKEDLVQVEMKGSFEIKSIKWNEERLNNQSEVLKEKIKEAANDALSKIKFERQSIVLNVINEKMRL